MSKDDILKYAYMHIVKSKTTFGYKNVRVYRW